MSANEFDPGRRVDAHVAAWVQGPAFVPHESQDLIFDVGAGLLHVVEGSMISTLPLPPDEDWEKEERTGGEESGSAPVDDRLPSAPRFLRPSVPSAQSSSASCLPVSPPSPSSSHSSAESTLRAFLASSSSQVRHVAASPDGLVTAVLYGSGALELVDHEAEAVLGTDLDASVPKPALACFWTGGGTAGRELAVAGREGLSCFEPGREAAGLRLTRRLVLADLRWAVHDPQTRVALLGFGARGTKALPVFLGSSSQATGTCQTLGSRAPSEDGRRPLAEADAEAGSNSARPARAGGMQLPLWAFGRGQTWRSSRRAPSRQSSRAESPAPSRPSTPREAGRDRCEGFVKYPVLDLAPPWGAGGGEADDAGGRVDARAGEHPRAAPLHASVADALPDARSLGERLGLWNFWGSQPLEKTSPREEMLDSPDSPGRPRVSPPLAADEISARSSGSGALAPPQSSGSARPASPCPPARLPSTLHGVWLLSIYGQPHVAVHSEAAGQLRLLRLRRDLPPEALELRELPPGARVAVSVVDDLLVLHLVQARVALLVDVGGGGARRAMEPLCAPLPVRLVSWEEGEGAREAARASRVEEESGRMESGHRRRRSSISLSQALSRSLSLSLPAGSSHAPHPCSQPSSVLALPDWMADRGRGLVARLRLDLQAIATTLAGGSETAAGAADFAAPFLGPRVPSLAPVLAFLQRRRSGRSLSLALLRRLLRAAALGRAGAWRSFQESAEAVLAATRWVRARSGGGRGLDGLDLCRALLEPMWRDLEGIEREAVCRRDDARVEPVSPRNDARVDSVSPRNHAASVPPRDNAEPASPRHAAQAAVLTRAALALVVWVAPAAQPASAAKAPPAEALLAVQSAARLALRGLRAQGQAHVEEQLRRSWPPAWFALCEERVGSRARSLLDTALVAARGARVPDASPGELLAALARSGDRPLVAAYWRVCRRLCAPPPPPLDAVLRYYGLAGFGEKDEEPCQEEGCC